MTTKTKKSWFTPYGELNRKLPKQCINDCAHTGNCSQDVKYWITELDFQVPDLLARKYLQEFGAWDDLDTCDIQTLTERVLWVACGYIKDSGEWFGVIE